MLNIDSSWRIDRVFWFSSSVFSITKPLLGAKTNVRDAKALEFDILEDEEAMMEVDLVDVSGSDELSCSVFLVFCNVDTQLVDPKRTRKRFSLRAIFGMIFIALKIQPERSLVSTVLFPASQANRRARKEE